MTNRFAVRAALTAVCSTFIGAAAFQSALAQETVSGNIPPGGAPIIVIPPNSHLGQSGTVLKFLFSAPAPTVGGYAISFCVGPLSNPCGTSSSYVVEVTGGTSMLALIPAGAFAQNELVVGQGTTSTVPFSVTIE